MTNGRETELSMTEEMAKSVVPKLRLARIRLRECAK